VDAGLKLADLYEQEGTPESTTKAFELIKKIVQRTGRKDGREKLAGYYGRGIGVEKQTGNAALLDLQSSSRSEGPSSRDSGKRRISEIWDETQGKDQCVERSKRERRKTTEKTDQLQTLSSKRIRTKQQRSYSFIPHEYRPKKKGERVEAFVDGAWRLATVHKLDKKNHPYLNVDGYLGEFTNTKIRQIKEGRKWTDDELRRLEDGILRYGKDWNTIWQKMDFVDRRQPIELQQKFEQNPELSGASTRSRSSSDSDDEFVDAREKNLRKKVNAFVDARGKETKHNTGVHSPITNNETKDGIFNATSETRMISAPTARSQTPSLPSRGEIKVPDALRIEHRKLSQKQEIREEKEQNESVFNPESDTLRMRCESLTRNHQWAQTQILRKREALNLICKHYIKATKQHFGVQRESVVEFLKEAISTERRCWQSVHDCLFRLRNEILALATFMRNIRSTLLRYTKNDEILKRKLVALVQGIEGRRKTIESENVALQEKRRCVEEKLFATKEEETRLIKEYLDLIEEFGFTRKQGQTKIQQRVPAKRLLPLYKTQDRNKQYEADLRSIKTQISLASAARERLAEAAGKEMSQDVKAASNLFHVGDEVLVAFDSEKKKTKICGIDLQKNTITLMTNEKGNSVEVPISMLWLEWNKTVIPLPPTLLSSANISTEPVDVRNSGVA